MEIKVNKREFISMHCEVKSLARTLINRKSGRHPFFSTDILLSAGKID
jgi:hypothetical protein